MDCWTCGLILSRLSPLPNLSRSTPMPMPPPSHIPSTRNATKARRTRKRERVGEGEDKGGERERERENKKEQKKCNQHSLAPIQSLNLIIPPPRSLLDRVPRERHERIRLAILASPSPSSSPSVVIPRSSTAAVVVISWPP